MSLVIALLGALRASLRTRTNLALENLALRQQLVLLRRRSKRPQFGRLDRLFCLWLSHQWAGWRGALHVVRLSLPKSPSALTSDPAMMRRCAPSAPCSLCCELYSSLRDPGFEPAVS